MIDVEIEKKSWAPYNVVRLSMHVGFANTWDVYEDFENHGEIEVFIKLLRQKADEAWGKPITRGSN